VCGAHRGPDHDDAAASALCDAYHGFTRADLPVLEQALGEREREIVWKVALGIGPEALAGPLRSTPDALRVEMRALTHRLETLQDA